MRTLLAIVVCALLLIGVWRAISPNGHPSTPAPGYKGAYTGMAALRRKAAKEMLPMEPPLGTPLVTSYQSLSKRALAGDNEAAIRLFDDLSECLRVTRMQALFQADIKDKNSFLNNPGGLHFSGKEQTRDLDVIQKELDEIQRADVLCGNLPDDFNDGRIYQAALRAAHAGDANATACLLIAPYDTPRPTPEQGREYAAEVMQLAEDGLRQGNWNVAQAMTFIYSSMSYDGMASHLGYQGFLKRLDPVKELQYSELIRLGTPGNTPEAAGLDRRLSMLRNTMTLAQQAAADRWAQETYARYFLQSGFVNPESSPCSY